MGRSLFDKLLIKQVNLNKNYKWPSQSMMKSPLPSPSPKPPAKGKILSRNNQQTNKIVVTFHWHINWLSRYVLSWDIQSIAFSTKHSTIANLL